MILNKKPFPTNIFQLQQSQYLERLVTMNVEDIPTSTAIRGVTNLTTPIIDAVAMKVEYFNVSATIGFTDGNNDGRHGTLLFLSSDYLSGNMRNDASPIFSKTSYGSTGSSVTRSNIIGITALRSTPSFSTVSPNDSTRFTDSLVNTVRFFASPTAIQKIDFAIDGWDSIQSLTPANDGCAEVCLRFYCLPQTD